MKAEVIEDIRIFSLDKWRSKNGPDLLTLFQHINDLDGGCSDIVKWVNGGDDGMGHTLYLEGIIWHLHRVEPFVSVESQGSDVLNQMAVLQYLWDDGPLWSCFSEKKNLSLVMEFYDRICMNAVQSASVKDEEKFYNINLIKGVEWNY